MNELKLTEVKLLVDEKVVNETLQRIGIANKKRKILYPSCYLYQKDNKNYIVHFKELFLLSRAKAYNAICEDDILRKNAIIFCLKNWNLIDVDLETIMPHDKFIFVLSHKNKYDWRISHKINWKYIADLSN